MAKTKKTKASKKRSLRGTDEPVKKSKTGLIIGAIAAAGVGFFLFSAFKKDDKKNNNNNNNIQVDPTFTNTIIYNPFKLGKTNKQTTGKVGKTTNPLTADTVLIIKGADGVNKYYNTDKGFIPVSDVSITGTQVDTLAD